MITFLCLPRRFTGEFDTLQRQAIRSWQRSVPGSQVIVFGEEPGAHRAVRELGVTQCLDIDYNAQGRPLVDKVFALGERYATHGWICFCSADVQLEFDAPALLGALAEVERPFVIGQRWDIEGDTRTLHLPCGVDYFLYRRGTIGTVPPFIVGGGGGDQWMVYKALTAWSMTVIDATAVITALHINHSHPEWANGKAGREGSYEQRYNRRLLQADGMARMVGIESAPWMLQGGGMVLRERAGQTEMAR